MDIVFVRKELVVQQRRQIRKQIIERVRRLMINLVWVLWDSGGGWGEGRGYFIISNFRENISGEISYTVCF